MKARVSGTGKDIDHATLFGNRVACVHIFSPEGHRSGSGDRKKEFAGNGQMSECGRRLAGGVRASKNGAYEGE